MRYMVPQGHDRSSVEVFCVFRVPEGKLETVEVDNRLLRWPRRLLHHPISLIEPQVDVGRHTQKAEKPVHRRVLFTRELLVGNLAKSLPVEAGPVVLESRVVPLREGLELPWLDFKLEVIQIVSHVLAAPPCSHHGRADVEPALPDEDHLEDGGVCDKAFKQLMPPFLGVPVFGEELEADGAHTLATPDRATSSQSVYEELEGLRVALQRRPAPPVAPAGRVDVLVVKELVVHRNLGVMGKQSAQKVGARALRRQHDKRPTPRYGCRGKGNRIQSGLGDDVCLMGK
mmetsp:Transcript_36479/g.85584  ORF Transcript_36479/g.85584 Transcript_36479/m.85584 type:complete len:286 (-) Transcript_36479:1051-1908(-)